MKLHALSCTQFAGLRDADVRFSNGINIIFGKNESGKSTLVNLLSRTIFQNARIDGRTDKDFRELFFPSAIKGHATQGDFADGKVTFESEKGTYVLTKEWGTEARCLLSTPEGMIRDPKTIDALLRGALVYGEGVYTHLLFSSQRGSDQALQTLLDASKMSDAKQEIVDAVTMAVAESDGVSVDVIEQAINEKINELVGKHWDAELDRPARKAGRWSSGLGEILKAYYALEDAKTVLDDIESFEYEADQAAANCSRWDEEVLRAEQAFDEFRGFAAALAVRTERKDKIQRLNCELSRFHEVLAKWPELQSSLEMARLLQSELHSRVGLDRYQAVKELVEERDNLSASISEVLCPSAEQIAAMRMAQRRIQTLQNQLCGMNLAAAVQTFGDHTLEIYSLRTGELLDVTDETVAITEAVSVVIPDVMEMRLAPADVDAEAIKAELDTQKQIINDCFEAFDVMSLEELEALRERVSADQRTLDTLQTKLSMLLGNDTYESLQGIAYSSADTVREEAAIKADIAALCGGDVNRFITVTETLLKGYETEYGTVDALKIKAFDASATLEKAKTAVEAAESIPVLYLSIADPEAHLERLQSELREAQRLREEALAAKTVAAGRLEGYKERLEGDPKENYAAALCRFQEQKELLAHWMHIREVFFEQKEQLNANPMVDVSRRFADNLRILSSDGVTTEFPQSDRLNMVLYSRDREMSFAKLSEGTKETVSLAFRLAMLDHLFPEGGVIVLDDPFANMDDERTKRSCTLLQDCATRHQVLFLTCKEEFADLLGGNVIRI